ncbi:hypothetical protein CFN79_13910 [Chromobacterium vaccinii]|uniref:hypothetical protein n=1 Tax=Chromobacterium vaccinii TaxID=1108595 RepID=UPI000CE9AC3E|nr:hypothetical protein [Chromobacterium vaccinii]AVG16857.1 hypothetical protein CFN79_13910 [Chromobacterium vaccinii]
MSTPQTAKKSFSFWIFLLQLAVAFFILLLFSAYVWGVQLKYDATKVGYERAFFYALLVFGAGVSYDCAKKILFLEQPTFIPFAKKFGESVFDICVIILFCAGTAFLLNIGYTVAGQFLYIAALGWVWFAIKSITGAIDVGSK